MMNYAGLDKELLLERAGEFIVNARKKNGITQEGLLRLIDKGCNPDTIAIVTLIRFFIRSSSFLLYAWLKRKIRISCREVKSTSLIP